MTQKERIVKLLINSAHCVMSRAEYEETAEFLLDNGVTVPGTDDALPTAPVQTAPVISTAEQAAMLRAQLGTTDGKPWLDKRDIAKRYSCCESKALNIIAGIKDTLGGGVLGKGKVLRVECERWEQMIREGKVVRL